MVNEKSCGIACVDNVIDVTVNNNDIFFNFIDIENTENKSSETIESSSPMQPKSGNDWNFVEKKETFLANLVKTTLSLDIHAISFLVLLRYETADDLESPDTPYVRSCLRVRLYKYYIPLPFNIFMGGNGPIWIWINGSLKKKNMIKSVWFTKLVEMWIRRQELRYPIQK